MKNIVRQLEAMWNRLQDALIGNGQGNDTAQRILAYVWMGDGSEIENWAAYGLIESLLRDEKQNTEHATQSLAAR